MALRQRDSDGGNRYRLGQAHPSMVGGIDRYVIAVGDRAVIIDRSNGVSWHVTYKTQRGAEAGLHRVRAQLPDAHIYDKQVMP